MPRWLIGSAFIALALLCLVAIVFFASWLGGGFRSFGGPVCLTHLGRLRSEPERVALARLAVDLRSHPDTQCFELRWTDSWLLGWTEEHEWFIEYDRRKQTLAEFHMESGPLEEWRQVPEYVIFSLTAGFDDRLLFAAGARSNLP
jgi:hypothetical protein